MKLERANCIDFFSKFGCSGQDTLEQASAMVVALGITLYTCLYYYLSLDFTLQAFTGRVMGIAVAQGVNTEIRPQIFYTLSAMFVFGICGVYLASLSAMQRLRNTGARVTNFEKQVVMFLSFFTICACIRVAMTEGDRTSLLVFASLFFVSVAIIGLRFVVTVLFKNELGKAIGAYLVPSSRVFPLLILLISLAAALASITSTGRVHLLFQENNKVMILAFLYVAAWVASSRKGSSKYLVSGYPLVFLPLAMPLASEMQYFLTKYVVVSVFSVYAPIALLVVTAAIVLFIRNTSAEALLNRERISIVWWYYPLFLITLVFNTYWIPSVHFGTGDLMHPGNNLVPAQQLCQFGAIPFVDIWAYYGIMGTIGPALYQLVYGSTSQTVMDAWVWQAIPIVNYTVTALLIYGVFAQCFSALMAFSLALLIGNVPLLNWTLAYYSMFLLPSLLVSWVLRNFSVRRIALLWLTTVFVFAWMPTTGKAAFLGVALFLCVYSLDDLVNKLFRIVKGFLLVFVPLGMVYVGLVYAKGISLSYIVECFRAMTSVEYIAHAYTKIAPSFSPLAFWYFVVTPALLLFVIALMAHKNKRHTATVPQWVLLSLCTILLVGWMRSLARHCLLEEYYIYTFYILLALLPVLWMSANRNFVKIWCGMLAIVMAVFFGTPPLGGNSLSASLHQFTGQRDVRTIIMHTPLTQNLIPFLQATLQGEETFLDMTNGHLLFVLSNKRNVMFSSEILALPTVRVQTAFIQHITKIYARGELPLVLMNSNFGGKNIDGMPVSMLHYKIAEFVYEHYLPALNIDGNEVWVAKNSRLNGLAKSADRKTTVLHIPLRSATSYSTHDLHIAELPSGLVLQSGEKDPFLINAYAGAGLTPFTLSETKGIYFLELTLENTTAGRLQVFFNFNGKGYSELDSTIVDLPQFSQKERVLIPFPRTALGQTLHDFRIDPPNATELRLTGITLKHSDSNQYPALVVRQQHPMGHIPWLWANHDPYKAIDNPRVATLCIPSALPGAVPLPQHAFPEGGYLLIRARAAKTTTLTCTVAKDGHAGTATLTLRPSSEPQTYLVRVGALYAWFLGPSEVSLASDNPVTVDELAIVRGD